MPTPFETEVFNDFDQIVAQHYESLYRFALSLTGTEADACDLTQHTFYIWATKGGQLRERSKVKTWLFTTLHRAFLSIRRRAVRFPQVELNEAHEDFLAVSVETAGTLDSARLLECLRQVPEPYRAALSLFYLQDRSYKDIAKILEIPLGTVRSRISRGIRWLQESILGDTGTTSRRTVRESDAGESRSPQPIPNVSIGSALGELGRRYPDDGVELMQRFI